MLHIETDPERAGGKPVIVGTRFTLAQVLAELAEGHTLDEIAQDYTLNRDILAAALNELAGVLGIIMENRNAS